MYYIWTLWRIYNWLHAFVFMHFQFEKFWELGIRLKLNFHIYHLFFVGIVFCLDPIWTLQSRHLQWKSCDILVNFFHIKFINSLHLYSWLQNWAGMKYYLALKFFFYQSLIWRHIRNEEAHSTRAVGSVVYVARPSYFEPPRSGFTPGFNSRSR